MANIEDVTPTLVGELGGVTYVLKELSIVAHAHGYSESHMRLLLSQRDIIAIKYKQKWFVEEHLSEHKRMALRQNSA